MTSDQVSIKQLMVSAERFERQGQLEKAAEVYATVLKREPDHKAASERLASIAKAKRPNAQVVAVPSKENSGKKSEPRKAVDLGTVASKTRAALAKIPRPGLPKVSLPSFLRRGKPEVATKTPAAGTARKTTSDAPKSVKQKSKPKKVIDFKEVASKTRSALKKIPTPTLPKLSLPAFGGRGKGSETTVTRPTPDATEKAAEKKAKPKARKALNFGEVATKTRSALRKISVPRLPTVSLPAFARRKNEPKSTTTPAVEPAKPVKSASPRKSNKKSGQKTRTRGTTSRSETRGANLYERLRNDSSVSRFNDQTSRRLKSLRPSFMRATPPRRRRIRSRKTGMLMMPIQKPKPIVSRERKTIDPSVVQEKTRKAITKITPNVARLTPKLPKLPSLRKMTPKVPSIPALSRALGKPAAVTSPKRQVLDRKQVQAKTRQAIKKIVPAIRKVTPGVPKLPAITEAVSLPKKQASRKADASKEPLPSINERARRLVDSAKASLKKMQAKRPGKISDPKKKSPIWPQLQLALRTTRENLVRKVVPVPKAPLSVLVENTKPKPTIPMESKTDKTVGESRNKGAVKEAKTPVRTVAVEKTEARPSLTQAERIRLAGQQLGADETDFHATTVLIESLSSRKEDNVELAAYLLGIYQPSDKRVVTALRSRLETTRGHVRVHVAEALLRNDHENPQAIEVLISQLRSGTRRMQMMSALAMHAAEGAQRRRCVAALIVALEDDDANVRAAAAAAVGGFGADAVQAAPALKKLAKDGNADTARVAGVALRCVLGEPVK